MNYSKIYKELVNSRKSRGTYKQDLDFFTEKHHINPKSLGGSDSKQNLVLLTPREHLVAHKLLVRIYSDSVDMWRALLFMSRKFKLSSREFSKAREEVSKMSTGSLNHFYGKTHSEENRKIMGDARRGKSMSRESIERTRKSNIGAKRSEKARQNMSRAAQAKNLKPWQTSKIMCNPTSLNIWARADSIYKFWLIKSKPAARKFRTLYLKEFKTDIRVSSINNMLLKFREGYIPTLDQDWLSFREDYFREE